MDDEELCRLLETVTKNFENRGFSIRNSPGLLNARFGYPFAPSAGHFLIDEIVYNPSPQPVVKYAVIPDRSMRMYDIEKIGISNRHLSFFEALVFGYAGATEELPKEEACTELFNLYRDLNLDLDRLLVTSLVQAKAEGREFDFSEDKIFYDTWVKLIGENKVKKTRGRRNLSYAREIGAPGGSGCEIFYRIGNKYLEIGSQINYRFKFTGGLERTRNAAIQQGFGLERLLMAIEEKEHVSDISLIFPIKDCIRDYLKTYGEDDKTVNLYDENLVKIADSIRAILFITHDTNGDLGTLSKSQRKILNNFKKVLNSEKSELNYLGIYDPKIYEDLVDVTIDLFKNRYQYMPQIKKTALEFINSTLEK